MCVSVKCALANVYVQRCDICVCSLSLSQSTCSERAHKGKKGTKRDVGCQNGIMLNNNVKLNNHNNTICALHVFICAHQSSVHAHHARRRAPREQSRAAHWICPFASKSTRARIFVSVFYPQLNFDLCEMGKNIMPKLPAGCNSRMKIINQHPTARSLIWSAGQWN
jgi:hypothetical protein